MRLSASKHKSFNTINLSATIMNKFFSTLLFALLLLGTANRATAQETYGEGAYAFNTYHKNIYVEGLGSSIIGGVHYDMRLNKGRMDGIGFRAGVGLAPLSGVTLATLPLEFNHVLGKKRSSLITGIGIIPSIVVMNRENVYLDDNQPISINERVVGLAGAYLTLGYRFQPLRNGVMFQINWNPILSGSTLSPRWFGISLGYGFK